jgi:hypothetical protein
MSRIIGKKLSSFLKQTEKSKVYCFKCRYYRAPEAALMMAQHRCAHPKFARPYDTPINQQIEYGDCMEINKNNDCFHFLEKGRKIDE